MPTSTNVQFSLRVARRSLDRSHAVAVFHGAPTSPARWDWRDPNGECLDVIVACPTCARTDFIKWDAIDGQGYAPFICCGCGLNRTLHLVNLMTKGPRPKRVAARAAKRSRP